MARRSDTHHITGTIDNLCFYKMQGKFYVRRKSSLSGKRVKKDPVFAATMYYANVLGTASKIASVVYRQLPKEQKIKGLYRELTGEAMKLLKDGKTADDAEQQLQSKYIRSIIKKKRGTTIKRSHSFADAVLQKIFTESLTGFEVSIFFAAYELRVVVLAAP